MFTADDGAISIVNKNVNPLQLESVAFIPMVVNKVLKRPESSTSVRPDELPNGLLKSYDNSLALLLCHIFDTSFKDSRQPSSWKIAYVLPIHEKGC